MKVDSSQERKEKDGGRGGVRRGGEEWGGVGELNNCSISKVIDDQEKKTFSNYFHAIVANPLFLDYV